MKVASILYRENSFCKENNQDQLDYNQAQLVLGFGLRELVSDKKIVQKIKTKFPNAQIALCSSSGEIFEKEVLDDSITLTAISFLSTRINTSEISIKNYKSSFEAGKALIKNLPTENLKFVFVLSDGSKVNGSELVKGMNFEKPEDVLITGGLAGDGANFKKTTVGLNKTPESGKIIAIGFYGNNLVLSHGSLGGWESFGLERTVTKSNGNILYEIDEKNALDLYKNYLGKYADELPSSALLFPLSIKHSENQELIVRTILSINDEESSMTFAGDIPVGSKVRFMKANFDRLIDAANIAATTCMQMNKSPKLALLISCVGRKLILGSRIDEEVEAVAEVFEEKTILSGFYSYGEISPLKPMASCELHNQTMTITGIDEKE